MMVDDGKWVRPQMGNDSFPLSPVYGANTTKSNQRDMALVLQQLQQQQQQVVLGEVCQLVAGGRCEGQAQQFCMMVTSTQCCHN